ncbi:hypothetical protein Hanom_Chr11g01044351 [Helianthus anomalus]
MTHIHNLPPHLVHLLLQPLYLHHPNNSTHPACYGNSSNFIVGLASNPNTVRLDTSNFTKVSVEVAKEHMELLNTLVSSYCGLLAGRIGDINLTNKDYAQITCILYTR